MFVLLSQKIKQADQTTHQSYYTHRSRMKQLSLIQRADKLEGCKNECIEMSISFYLLYPMNATFLFNVTLRSRHNKSDSN